MKAEDMAPSPTISLSMLGMRKATKKASDRVPAPRVRAMTLSRMYPVTREVSVSGVMIEAERTRSPRVSSASSAPIGFSDCSRGAARKRKLSIADCRLMIGEAPIRRSIENRQSSMDSLGHHLSVIEFHPSLDHMKGG